MNTIAKIAKSVVKGLSQAILLAVLLYAYLWVIETMKDEESAYQLFAQGIFLIFGLVGTIATSWICYKLWKLRDKED